MKTADTKLGGVGSVVVGNTINLLEIGRYSASLAPVTARVNKYIPGDPRMMKEPCRALVDVTDDPFPNENSAGKDCTAVVTEKSSSALNRAEMVTAVDGASDNENTYV